MKISDYIENERINKLQFREFKGMMIDLYFQNENIKGITPFISRLFKTPFEYENHYVIGYSVINVLIESEIKHNITLYFDPQLDKVFKATE